MALGPAKIELAFLNEADPQLEKVKFYYDTELGEIQSIRGKSPGAWLSYNTFLWSPAVRALSLLCVKCACGVPDDDKISGEDGSLASSLDYAVAKGTAWLSDMFGVNEEGKLYCRKLLLRSNPERKRPGPVIVSLNPQILRASNIKIIVDDVELTDRKDLQSLGESLERNYFIRKPDKNRAKVPAASDKKITPAKSQKIVLKNMIPSGINKRPNFEIQYLTTPFELENEYINCLRRRIVNRQFAFLTETGVDAWFGLCDSGHFTSYDDSLALIKKTAGDLSKEINSPCNCIAVWPGSGAKELAFYDALREHTDCDLILVDISQEVINRTMPNYSGTAKVYIADFMKEDVFRRISEQVRDSRLNVFLFFGNTLGIFPQAEIAQKILAAMKPEDLCLFGLSTYFEAAISDDEERLEYLIAQYERPEMKKQMLSSLELAGISLEQGVIEIESRLDRFLPHIWIVEHYFRFTTPFIVVINGEEIPFFEGERIQVGFFYLYTRTAVEKILVQQGFEIVSSAESKEHSVIQLLCRRSQKER